MPAPAERRALLVEAVLQLLAVQFHEDLAGPDAIAKIGHHAAYAALGFGRYGDLVDGRQRAHHFNAAAKRFLTDGLDRNGLGLAIRRQRMSRLRLGARGRGERDKQAGSDHAKIREQTESHCGE